MEAPRVLVIDDSTTLRKLVEIAMRGTGCRIDFAANGSDGVSCARANRPDVILLDYLLPDLRSAEVCQRLRDNTTTSSVPVVIMSANEPSVLDDFREFQAVVGFIGKPFTPAEIRSRLEGVVERGTATVLRDLNRPMFGKTGTTSGPTNVWFVGGTPEVVAGVYLGYDKPRSMGGYAQGGRIAAPIFKDFARVAFKDMPKVPFVAPQGIRWVRVDRATGRRVFGAFPVQEDPKSAVIWEAFQPQTEPRRFRRSHPFAGPGQPGAEDDERDPARVAQLQRRPRVVRARQPRDEDASLQDQGAIY